MGLWMCTLIWTNQCRASRGWGWCWRRTCWGTSMMSSTGWRWELTFRVFAGSEWVFKGWLSTKTHLNNFRKEQRENELPCPDNSRQMDHAFLFVCVLWPQKDVCIVAPPGCRSWFRSVAVFEWCVAVIQSVYSHRCAASMLMEVRHKRPARSVLWARHTAGLTDWLYWQTIAGWLSH